MSERREAFRRRVYLGGKVVHHSVHFYSGCLVRDLSPGGLRLILEEDITLPERFDLFIESQDVTHPVEIVWRQALQLGVRLLEGTPQSGEAIALRGVIDDHRRELTRLRSRVADLELQAKPASGAIH